MRFKLFDQIAFAPGGDMDSDRVEYGFVSGLWGANGIFCRYWINGQPGKLRTISTSERTYPEDLVLHKSVPKKVIAEIVKKMESNPDKYGFVGEK